MDKNFNTSPYYDDFDQTKNYLRILFKPGYAVQARELTQLQTAINKQITDFGTHIFKDGSIVLNGNTNLYEAQYVNVDVSAISVAAGDYISGGTSEARGKVIKKEFVDATTQRVYFTYVSSAIFAAGETITVESSNNTYTLKDTSDFSGKSSIFSIDDSIFFIKGNFVFCDAQDIVIDNSFFSVNLRVGLDVTEAIVTYDDDESLLDPAQGSNNYAAPGADRYTIALSLNKYRYDPQDEGLEDTGNFIELARIVGNQIVSKVNGASYSQLETTLARRTYDESGDYTVKSFGLSVKKHIYGDSDKFSLAIDPGKAYVKGYEFETISTQHVDLDKALDLAYNNGALVQVDFGSYMFVNTPSGALNYNDNQTVNIKNSSGAVIGTATINTLQYNSTGVYKLYLYNVTINSGYGYSIADARSFSLGNWSATVNVAAYGSAGVSLVKSPSLTSITRLPNSPINTLLNANSGLGDTQYVVIKSVTATFTNINESDPNLPVVIGGTINVGAVDNEVFIGNSTTDYIVQNISTGQFYNVNSVSGSGGSRTIIIDSAVAVTNARVYAKVGITQAQQSNKSLQTGTKTASITNGKISLSTSDCYELVSVTARSTFNTTVLSLDVTDKFIFNNGQKDDLYDHGWVQLKSGASISKSYDQIDIVFTYFSHSTTSGFFSVDSYTGTIDYDSIPTYTSSKGEVYQLNSCIDFRPVRANGDNSTAINGSYKIIPDSIVSADYSYYLSRIDKLVLTKERQFSVIKGISAEVPAVPEDMFDAMTLYVINVPANKNSEKDVTFTYIDNRRYTMRDIGKIDKRIQRIEYYTSLSFLEKQAKDEAIPSEIPGVERFKNGILVDSFAGHSVGNASDPDYACSIDKENRILRPKFAPFSLGYVPNTLTNAVKEGDLITLPYTEESFLEQPYATTWVNVNPYAVFDWNGSITLTPATDNWVETHVLPAVTVNLNGENDVYTVLNDSSTNTNSLGVIWDDWRTVVKGAITNIQDNYKTTSNASTLLNVETGGQTVSNTTLVTNNENITTTSVKLQTGIQVLTSDTKILTKDLGSKVVDTSIVPYVRSRTLTFAAKNLKPKTQLFASFDGVNVGTYCSVALEIRFSGTIDPTLTRIRNSANTKTATMILAKTNRAFVQMDQGSSAEFVVGDAVEVFNGSSWVSAGTISAITRTSTLTTNDQGDIAGFFRIPDPSSAGAVKFRTGELLFRLSDSLTKNATTAAEVKYVAQGLSQSTERTIVATRVASATVKPVSNQTTTTSTSSNQIVVSQNTAVVNIPPPPAPVTLMVDDTQFSNSKKGTFEYLLDFTTSTGQVGVRISPTNGIPVRYSVTWDGHTYTTGFVGNSSYNDILVANGYPKVTTNHVESLSFNKTSATPQVAYLKVEAPIVNSDWGVKVIGVAPPVPVPTYTITSDITSVNEGGVVTYTVGTTNVAANTTLYWTLEGTATSGDFADSATSGSVTINQLGTATFTRTISSDLTTEGTETFKLNLRTGSYSGTIVASSSSVTIVDTSLTGVPSYSIKAESALVEEGTSIAFTVNTKNVADNTVLYWTLSSGSTVSAADFSGGVGSGSVTIINNTATFTRFLLADNSAEGNEKFSLDLRTTSTSGTIVATSETVTVVDNSAVYTISAGQTTVNEGDAVQFIVSTLNIANNTTLYWKIKSGSTATGADFTDGASSGSVVIQNNSAIITRTTTSDSATEGDEQFQLELLTGSINGTSVATSQQVTIVDTSRVATPVYAIASDVTSVNEGGIVTYTVSTQNVGSATLYWRLKSGSTATGADFTDGASSGTVNVVNNVATFTRQILADTVAEGNELFQIELLTGSTSGTVVATSQQVTIINAIPVYSISSDVTTVNEGGLVTFTVTTQNLADGTLYWALDASSTTAAADFTDGITSGSISVVNGLGVFTRSLVSDASTEGTEKFIVNLKTGSTSGTTVASSQQITVIDTSGTALPVYAITSDVTNVNEGGIVTYTVTTQNVANTTLYWALDASSTAAGADFEDSATSGSISLVNGVATFTRQIASDSTTEGNETFKINLKTGSTSGTTVATSQQVTIVDTSSTPDAVYSIRSDVTRVNEGGIVTYTISTQNVADTTLYWALTNSSTASSADFEDSATSGSISLVNNIATFTRQIADDATTEGIEKFAIDLKTGSTSGTTVATSQQVTIIDTSSTPSAVYSINADKVTANEGEIVTFTISTQNVANTTLYWALDASSTISSGDFVGGATTGSVSLVNGIATFTRQISEDATTEGSEVFKINLKTGSTSGTTVASSQQITIVDTSKTSSPAYAIAASNNLISEGDTVLFSVNTKNVSDGTTLYWRFDPSSTVSAADLVSGSTTGTVSVSNNTGLFSLSLKSDSTTEGSENFKVILSTTNGGSAVATTADIYVVDSSSTPIPVYSITPDSTKINEGDSVTFIVSTQNVANGTTLYWNMTGSPTTISSTDLAGATSSGSVTIQNNTATFRISTRTDAVEEGNETFTIELKTGSITGTVVATAPTVTVVDVFEKPSTYNISASVSSIGTRVINQSTVTWIPHTPVMMESKSLGAAVTISWNGTKNSSPISNNVRYQLASITVSDPRIKLFSTPQEEKYSFPGFPGWGTNGSFSVTPLTVRDLWFDNPRPSYVAWQNWWNCEPPIEMTASPPTGVIKTSGQPVPVYMVFNPYVGNTVATGWGGDSQWIAGNTSNPWGKLGPQTFNFTITATWQYVGGDDSIPLAQRTIVDVSSGTIRLDEVTQYDPVAQTFFVSAQQYPNGVFIKSIDLFFKSKSSTAPVEVQIRPTVNGYPSSSVILPFASTSKEASQINVSATGTVATNFKFSNVIHLAPGEYSFVVITNTDEYNLFTSKIGDFSLVNTSQRITSQPLLGSMFKSQNASAWTPVQEEDVKFKLYKCAFPTTQNGTVIYNADTNDVTGDVPYEVFFTSGEVVDFSTTDIKYAVKNSTTESFIDYQLGSNVELPTTKTLLKSTPSSMQFKTILSTNSRDVTPIIDINRLSSVLVKNTINNDSTDETLPFGGKASAKYITRSVKLNTGFDSTDLKVYFNAKLPSGTSVKVYYKISSASDTVFVDNNYTEMVIESAGTYSENKYVEYKYKTPWDSAFQTGERFDTFSVKIVMLSENPAKVPMIKDLRVVAIDV